MDTPLPKLRAIEAFPVDVEREHLVCLRDPLRYAAEPLLVPAPAFYVLTLLDGQRSLGEVHDAFTRRFGSPLAGDDLERLLTLLDTHHFLDSSRFSARRAEIDAAFAAAPLRPAAHAGSSYPAEPDVLQQRLAGFFTDLAAQPRPLAALPHSLAALPHSLAALPRPRPLAALVAPHIDLRVGGRAYGHAYAALAAAPPASRFVVLGTAHGAGTRLFAATRKDFATPLGTVATERGFVDRLAARAPDDLFAEEHLHRSEHAIEFQVVMLQHVLGGRPFTLVPILVTSFHELIARRRTASDDARITGFVAALRATLAEDAVPTTIVAGVDLAHVGAKFGDRDGLTPALLAATEAKDRSLIAALERGDPDEFFATIVADGDRTRICGTAPLLTLLALRRGARGRLLCYDRTRDESTRSSVTYASLAFDAE